MQAFGMVVVSLLSLSNIISVFKVTVNMLRGVGMA